MSERILKALMRLFAIVAGAKDVSGKSREIVEAFLKERLNSEQVLEFLKIFDEYLDAQTKKGNNRKKTSVNSVKVLRICTEINEELMQTQKIVVLLTLIEFIYGDNIISDQELEFITTVAETFNINSEEFSECLLFAQCKVGGCIDDTDTLLIDNRKEKKHPDSKYRHITTEGLDGEVHILRIKSVHIYAFRYFGDNELYINGRNIKPERIYLFTQGTSIRSSKVQPVYYSDVVSAFLSDETKEKIVFKTTDLQYKFRTGNIGMHNLNFTEESGRLIGIMGASGAGKSTLLNLLNGNYKPTSGSITINGINIHTEQEKIEGVIGYVSQDDLLIEELTVFQNLYFNAKLCFKDMPQIELEEKVLNMLMSIGLEEVKDLKVGSPLDKTISGGQRKRLNISLELIREPSVLFVDEPTSGLSSRDSENIMDLLKELALKGKLIFVVIHQPSSDIFKMFDSLLILDTGGYPIYNGHPVDAVIYFKKLVNHVNSDESECIRCGNVNPEQIFDIIEEKVVDEYGRPTQTRKKLPKEWYSEYLKNIESKKAVVDLPNKKPSSDFQVPNKWQQFKVFITRDVLSKLTNRQYLLINLLEAPILAFILAFIVRFYSRDSSNHLGYVFKNNDNIPAYLFMCVIVALFIGLTLSAEEIIRDRKIRKREQFLNLSKGSYLLSKVIIMFCFSAIQAFLFVIIGNLMLGIHGMFFSYWFVFFTTACFANMMGLNISSAFDSAVTIYILIPILLIPQLILSGVIVKFDKLNPKITSQNKVPIIGDIMASRWAFEALAVNQFKNNKFEAQFYPYDKVMKEAEFKNNFWIPKMMSKIDFIENNLKIDSVRSKVILAIRLVKNEINGELRNATSGLTFTHLGDLNIKNFSSKTAQEVDAYLNALKQFYVKQYNNVSDKRDAIVVAMNQTPQQKAIFLALKNRFTNQSLSNLVTNNNDFTKIVEYGAHLYQKATPIYLDPTSTRTHFFAPRKIIFGHYLSTFSFDNIIIWLMSLILAITLYFDSFRKMLKVGKLFYKLKK